MYLVGKRILVTGAGSGIGRAVAIGYARAGAAVACVSRGRENLLQTERLIENAGGRALALPADVSDFEALEQQVLAVERELGGLDLVFSAAGEASENKTVETSDVQAFRRTLEVNLVGAFNTAKAAIPALKRSGGGHMIFVGSGMGHRAAATRAAYASSKAGLHMLVRVLAQELIEDGIAVNELVPGPVLTAFITGRVEQLTQSAGAQEWFKTPEDVVPMALFLASQLQPGPTGQTFSLARREL
ncbi:SDR family NAD(P)-dependent oxidoreductase [Rhodoferax sediminis]|nr:SDR family oxidoreductase [Rhodoferax sediminis]